MLPIICFGIMALSASYCYYCTVHSRLTKRHRLIVTKGEDVRVETGDHIVAKSNDKLETFDVHGIFIDKRSDINYMNGMTKIRNIFISDLTNLLVCPFIITYNGGEFDLQSFSSFYDKHHDICVKERDVIKQGIINKAFQIIRDKKDISGEEFVLQSIMENNDINYKLLPISLKSVTYFK